MQPKLSGTAGQIHIVKASTNLLDWEAIGVATERADGSFEFEDAQTASLPRRFSRVVGP